MPGYRLGSSAKGRKMVTRRHRFRIGDIALQARLSRATVDRVLHGRSGVRPETIAQVEHAIAELERQRSEILLSRMPAIFDLVIQSCAEFGAASQEALEGQIRSLRAHGVRARTHVETRGDTDAVVAVLDDIARRGSHGAILKAHPDIEVSLAVNRLAEKGIPTVTYVTDLPDSRRIGHVGPDHLAAGRTAAYLVHNWSPPSSGVLMALVQPYLGGQAERRRGFVDTLTAMQSGRPICEHLDMQEAAGPETSPETSIAEMLDRDPSIDVIYTPSSHCESALAAFASVGRLPRLVIAHELNTENRRLLREERLSAVLHYDLDADLQKACVMLFQARAIVPGAANHTLSQVQILTPYNMPGRAPQSGDVPQ